MRLICPNCAAQYEVEDHVIPAAGRDVQCSNCGHTWFQEASAAMPAPTAEPSRPVQPQRETVSQPPEREVSEKMARAVERVKAAEAAAQNELSAQRPRELDEDIADILRQEAAEESAKRAQDAPSARKESEPDLGPAANAEEVPANLQERMARMREPVDELSATEVAAAPDAGNRKDLLPDIEEINSTLSPQESGADASPDTVVAARRGGFRRGFALVVLLFAIMVLIYMFAPQIVEMNPQTEPTLSSYVNWVNNLRASLDGFLSRAAISLNGLLSGMDS